MVAAYLFVCSLTFMGVSGLECGSPASLKDKLETEAGGFLLGVARPENEGVRLQSPSILSSSHDLMTPTCLTHSEAAVICKKMYHDKTEKVPRLAGFMIAWQ